MRYNSLFLISFILIALCITSTSYAKSKSSKEMVNYANNYSEFSVGLPEAPSVRTLWADGKEAIPYIKNIPQSGAIGEVAFYDFLEPENKDDFRIEIKFLKVDKEFIANANEATLMSFIKKDFQELPPLEDINIKYDDTTNPPAKHAIVTGVIYGKKGLKEFNAEHFLVGTESITVIRTKFNANNLKLVNLYKNISASIKYLPL